MITHPTGGWFKLAGLLIHVFFSIVGQEGKHNTGAGAVKKKEVMRSAEEQARNLAVVTGATSCSMEQIMEHISETIDHVVGLLNCLGLFK